jgi:hypothetical protein
VYVNALFKLLQFHDDNKAASWQAPVGPQKAELIPDKAGPIHINRRIA